MNNKKGFTLVEIIVSVCLLAVLMALTVPGLMNYFDDVDQDKYVAETRSVVAQIKASKYQLSLAGSAGANELDETTVNKIIKDAECKGIMKKLKEENGILSGEYWINDSQYVLFKVGGVEDHYSFEDKNMDDIPH